MTLALLPPHDFTDRELVTRMLARDSAAWREFHRRFDGLIYRCIYRVTTRFRGVLGSDAVGEIYSLLMLNLSVRDMHRLRAFEPERGNKLGTWIGMLATNAAWDHLRAASRQPKGPDVTEIVVEDSAAPSPFEQVAVAERWQRVNEALRSFSSKDRDFIQLYYVDGRSAEEVAAELEISVKTVYSKKHKIRSRLALQLAAAG
jgi:RNA polymerase sigma-70 factor (ECF subfamily)